MGRFKGSVEDINYGPKEAVDKLTGAVIAHELMSQGYRRISNAYSLVARIDRKDWLDVLAERMRCARADSYDKDGSGVGDRWRDHYIRTHSSDVLALHPSVSVHVKAY